MLALKYVQKELEQKTKIRKIADKVAERVIKYQVAVWHGVLIYKCVHTGRLRMRKIIAFAST